MTLRSENITNLYTIKSFPIIPITIISMYLLFGV